MCNTDPMQDNDGLLTVTRLIEMLQKLPGEALVVIADPPSTTRHAREPERYYKTLADVQATVASVLYSSNSQREVQDAKSGWTDPRDKSRDAVCLQLK